MTTSALSRHNRWVGHGGKGASPSHMHIPSVAPSSVPQSLSPYPTMKLKDKICNYLILSASTTRSRKIDLLVNHPQDLAPEKILNTHQVTHISTCPSPTALFH